MSEIKTCSYALTPTEAAKAVVEVVFKTSLDRLPF